MGAEKITKLYKRKQKLLEAVEIIEKSRKQITEFTKNLLSLYNSREISKQEYEEKLNKALKKRTPEQWLKYYDDYIQYYKYQINLCEKQINQEKSKARKSRTIPILKTLIVLVSITLIISLGVILKSPITDFSKNIIEGISKTELKAGEVAKIPEPELLIKVPNEVNILEDSLTQYQAVLGKPVKWKKQFTTDSLTGFTTELPEGSENIIIKTIKDGKKEDITQYANIGEKFFGKKIKIELKKRSITGNAIADSNEKQEFEIIYETPAPEVEEEIISRGKRIVITGPDNLHYKNILSFTELPRELTKEEVGKLKLYQIKNNQREAVRFTAYDTDENSLLDYIEWIADSDSVFELVIEISKAEHLDENKNFISDIYEQVKSLDDIWSEEILAGHYIRVTFSRKLDNSRDITIYPRVVSGNPKIEVYEVDGTEKIAEFTSLNLNQYNKVFLTNLPEGYSQDVFDLKIVDGVIEIEHIVDPITTLTPIVHVNTELNGVDLTPTEVNYITNDDSNNILITKGKLLTTEFSDISQIAALNDANCSLTYFTDAGFPNEGVFQVYDSFGGNLLNSVTITASTTDRTISLIDLETKGLSASEINTLVVRVQNIITKKPYSIYIDKISCAIDYTLTADTTPPEVNLISPKNNTILNNPTLEFNCSMSDTGGLKNSTLYGNWSGGWHANETQTISGFSNETNFTKTISDGNYIWNCYVCDNANNCAFNNTNWTFTIDTTAPIITIISPLNQTYNTSSILINFIADSYQNLWYYNGTDNRSYTSAETITASQGSSTFIFYANDSTGNLNQSKVTFFVDSIYPLISFSSGTEDDEADKNQNWVYVNVTWTESNFANITFSLYNDSGNVNSTTFTTPFYTINWTNLAYANYTYNVSVIDSANNFNSTETRLIKLSSPNQPPQITYISSIPETNPAQNSSTTINFNITVYDANGFDNINDSSVKADFTKPGEATRTNNCSKITGENTLTSQNYSCAIDMWYWDEAGYWNVTIYAADLSGNAIINDTIAFKYNLLNSIAISSTELFWPELIPGAENQTLETPVIIRNTGNYIGNILILAINLHGETETSEYIGAANFAVGLSNKTEDADYACAGTALQNGTNIAIAGATLERGNLSAGQAQKEIFYCLKEVPLISSQTYSTKQAGSWTITLFAAMFIIKKKKKKEKQINKNIQKDSLIISLNLMAKELRQEYSEEKQKIIKLLAKEIKKKYKINNKQISEITGTREEVEIPISIFSNKLGALEAITKYLKENLNMNYHEIAGLLKRDERTIWTAYSKASQKQPEPMQIKETPVKISISIFNKKLTILEAAIIYLKQQKLKYVEIARLLNRNQRNIWTIYSNAIKK